MDVIRCAIPLIVPVDNIPLLQQVSGSLFLGQLVVIISEHRECLNCPLTANLRRQGKDNIIIGVLTAQ